MKNLIWLFGGAAVLAVVLLAGCENDQAANPTAPGDDSTAAAVEQTVCPVISGKIDKDIFVEYNGRKIYFCCKSCVATFNENPERYLDKINGGATHSGSHDMHHDGSVENMNHAEGTDFWTCSMHPDIRQDEPGACPTCGMKLILQDDETVKETK